MTEQFKKYDNQKIDLTLAPPCLNQHYTCVAMIGEKKYGRNNWKKAKLEDVKRYYAAMLRHQTAEMLGEKTDPESDLPHGWHALWNRTSINYFIEKFGYEEVIKTMNGDEND